MWRTRLIRELGCQALGGKRPKKGSPAGEATAEGEANGESEENEEDEEEKWRESGAEDSGVTEASE